MNIKTKQTLAVGLSIVGAIGTITTSLLVRKAAIKESKDIIQSNMLGHELTTKESFKRNYKHYIPAAAIGVATVTSILASTILSRKVEASLASMAVLADQGWRKYKHQVKKLLGDETNEKIISGIAKDEMDKSYLGKQDDEQVLYFEEHVGYFKARPEDIAYAYAKINEMMNVDTIDGTAYSSDDQWRQTESGPFLTIARFLEYANADMMKNSAKTQIAMDAYGWTSDYLIDKCGGSAWISINIVDDITDDKVVPFKVISFLQDPIYIDINGVEVPWDMKDELEDHKL